MDVEFDPAKSQKNEELRGLAFPLVADLDWSSAVVIQDVRKP